MALCGTNQIEATKLRVHSTNERAGYNPLTEAEDQTRLSIITGHVECTYGDGKDQRKCAFLLFPLEYYIFSKGLVWWN